MPRQHNRRFCRLGGEWLEKKLPLAGDVSVSLVNGLLEIDGDNANNAIEVFQTANGNVFVRGAADISGVPTTVNGAAQVRFVQPTINAIDIDMGIGNDRVDLNRLTLSGPLVVDTGGGSDRLFLADTNVGGATIIDTAGGNDRVDILRSVLQGLTDIDTLAGDDTLVLRTSDVLGFKA